MRNKKGTIKQAIPQIFYVPTEKHDIVDKDYVDSFMVIQELNNAINKHTIVRNDKYLDFTNDEQFNVKSFEINNIENINENIVIKKTYF